MARRKSIDTSIADRQKIGTFVLNGRTFVSGLHWETLDNVSSFMKEARSKGRQWGMDVVATRKGVDLRSKGKSAKYQAGYAPKNRGAAKGMYSLASVLASEFGSNWIGAFRIEEERYALAAVVDGSIVPSADRIGTLSEIREELGANFSHLAGSGVLFEHVIAPPEFEFGDKQVDLASLLVASKLKPEHRLKPLTLGLSKGELFRLILFAAIIIAGGSLYILYQARQEEMLRRADQAQKAARSRAEALLNIKPPPPAPPPPWLGSAKLTDTVAACSAAFDKLPLVLGGWFFEKASCNAGGALSAAYKRGHLATANSVLSAADAAGLPLDFYDAGESGVVNVLIQMPSASSEELLAEKQVMARLVSHFQAADVKFPLQKQAVPETPPGEEPTTSKPTWSTYTFEIVTQMPPVSLMEGLAADGLRAETVAVSLDGDAARLTWTINGALYVR
ncbi:type 4b pilus protein PilO2 [Xanthomonas campestris]|uniref:type 4b pilus protein PilO2 n=1 Tax=Xanthomonas campestris TaxID=339 RepID=UPI001C85E129|nr:type 4b pilus protein PilO2 [Xanthomonas campestris]MCF8869894.1 type 4b pilus protein PilO2 [Xanthomonas campestris pv. campestris]MDM7717840.1 type 4b pilus protein PilO2 [Xanthomonas campestris pv. campestris]MEA0952189.1 type 4b pilus protein PilO2 [Xanthomonas campestris pv. campestris]MEB1105257.1 type 4b pilus protein PilO2 [Xanthomonas campestris pv. campestris]MEB1623070.1 type 4b pilus protein PilO2 [Xanthomonas campestris pv. campestris]